MHIGQFFRKFEHTELTAYSDILFNIRCCDPYGTLRQIFLEFLRFYRNLVKFRSGVLCKKRCSIRHNIQPLGLKEGGYPTRHFIITERITFEYHSVLGYVLVQSLTLVRRCPAHKYHQHSGFHWFRSIDTETLQRLHTLRLLEHYQPALRHHRVTPRVRHYVVSIRIQAEINRLIEIPFRIGQRELNYFFAYTVGIIRFRTHQQIYRGEMAVSDVHHQPSVLIFRFYKFCHC